MPKRYTIRIEPAVLDSLNKVADIAAEAEARWLTKQREQLAGMRGLELSEARRGIRIRLAERRERGELAGTRDLVVLRAFCPRCRPGD